MTMTTDTWVDNIHAKYARRATDRCESCEHAACEYARRTGFVYGAPMKDGTDVVARVTAALNDQRNGQQTTREGNAR